MKTQRFNTSIYSFTIFAAALLAYRILETDTLVYIFLAWNLFLAFIPFWISAWLKKQEAPKIKHTPLLFAWLLFLPNSPYIVTDLFHLKERAGIPLWFDLALVCSFAIIGLLLLFKSIIDMISVAKRIFSKTWIKYFLPFLFWLVAFGLYLGRYLRFNSWDIASHPLRLAKSSVHSLFCKDTIGFT